LLIIVLHKFFDVMILISWPMSWVWNWVASFFIFFIDLLSIRMNRLQNPSHEFVMLTWICLEFFLFFFSYSFFILYFNIELFENLSLYYFFCLLETIFFLLVIVITFSLYILYIYCCFFYIIKLNHCIGLIRVYNFGSRICFCFKTHWHCLNIVFFKL
jgi:hypothetical protein